MIRYQHLIAEGMQHMADVISNQLSWPYDSNVCGVVQDKTHGKDIYTIRQLGSSVYSIHSTECGQEVNVDGKLCCENCMSIATSLYRRCRNAVDL
jgi:hypothetical protein